MKKDAEMKRIQEKKVVGKMIELYCRGIHGGGKDALCTECTELRDYAENRSVHCPMMENKSFCSNCIIHCYKPEIRLKIKEVMRYAGPRMIFHHPLMAVKHMITARMEQKVMDNTAHDEDH